jgi:FkbM family methyltransferase|tara:strand:- start:469 stop:1590 length:1122 start_codon:yes stop_codon:yes gene_type:complete
MWGRKNLTFKENLGYVYFILPFIGAAENKVSLIYSILFGKSDYKIKIKNIIIKISRRKFDSVRSLLACLTYSTSYSLDSSENLEISFDENSKFRIALNKLSFENANLLELLHEGSKYGANFLTDIESSDIRKQTYTIISENNKKIVITSNGIKFFLDSIHPGNTIIETFIKEIHSINPKIDWNDKIVVDIGAECGDTPLYFASLGAKVFAFEPLKKHFEFFKKNISLNPTLSEKIIPINAAIGKDEQLKFYVSDDDETGTLGASFVSNNQQGKNFKYEIVDGYKLETARKKFGLNHIDLLKMDCKECEFYLTDEDLKDIDRIKLEYTILNKKFKLDDLLDLLKRNGFKCSIFRHVDSHRLSNRVSGTIYGTKI